MVSGIKTSVSSVEPTTQRVRFGTKEVRVFHPEKWETIPLLDVHKTKMIEAKIKAMPNQPMHIPQTIQPRITPKHNKSKKWIVFGVAAVVTGIVCGIAGPLGLIIPVVVIGLYFLSKTPSNKIKPEILKEQIVAIHDLQKLAEKYERAGLHHKAIVYRNLAQSIQKQIELSI